MAADAVWGEVLALCMTNALDRRILLALAKARPGPTYDELRRATAADDGEATPEAFKEAVDRLMAFACVDRRLVQVSANAYASHLALSQRGKHIVRIVALLTAALEDQRSVPAGLRREAARWLRGEAYHTRKLEIHEDCAP